MKITIEVKESEGTSKEFVEHELRKFLTFNFQEGSKAEIKIEWKQNIGYQ